MCVKYLLQEGTVMQNYAEEGSVQRRLGNWKAFVDLENYVL